MVESLAKKLKRKRIHTKYWVPVVAIMADLVLGAVLGTTLTVLYDAVDQATVGKFNKFKPLLGALQSTLDSIQPLVIKQIVEYNVKLVLPNDEIEKLVKQMEEGEKLVLKLSKLRFWNRIKSRYTDQLVELDRSLKGLLKHIVMQQARDIKENLFVVKETAKQLVQFQEFNEKLLRERTLLQENAKDLQDKFVLALQNNGKQLLQLQGVIEEMMKQQEAREVTTDAETGDLVGGDDLVELFKVLFGSVQQLFKENVTYKPVLKNIKSTLDSLGPLIEVIKENYESLNFGQKSQVDCLTIQQAILVIRFSQNTASGQYKTVTFYLLIQPPWKCFKFHFIHPRLRVGHCCNY